MKFMTRNGCALLAVLCLAVCGCSPGAPELAARQHADEQAVAATMQRYLQGLDRLDRDLYASAFAPDGVLDIDGSVRSGRDAMRKVVDQEAAFRQDMKDQGRTPRVLFHMETNVHLTFPAPDQATRTAYWVTYVREGKDPEGLSALGVGTSVDELQRRGAEWLITRRRISLQP